METPVPNTAHGSAYKASRYSPSTLSVAKTDGYHPVKFYRDGQWFVVLDNRGEKHKFSLIRAAKFE
jgi:hypothetical protein